MTRLKPKPWEYYMQVKRNKIPLSFYAFLWIRQEKRKRGTNVPKVTFCVLSIQGLKNKVTIWKTCTCQTRTLLSDLRDKSDFLSFFTLPLDFTLKCLRKEIKTKLPHCSLYNWRVHEFLNRVNYFVVHAGN